MLYYNVFIDDFEHVFIRRFKSIWYTVVWMSTIFYQIFIFLP